MSRNLPQTDLGKFHSKVIDFLDRFSKVYPTDKEIYFYAEKYKALKQANPRLTCEKFMEIILPYENYILNKDDKFFIDFDLSDIDSDHLKIISKIKELWQTNMSDNTKETIWKYLQVFIILGKQTNN